MAVNRCTKMSYASADEMIFGKAVKPVKAGLGLEIGAGYTTPEVNYAPRPEAGASKEKLIKEYERITTDIMQGWSRSVPSCSETEHVSRCSTIPMGCRCTCTEDHHGRLP